VSARRTSPILIGREAELRALEEAVLERAERPVALVGGEAGVGKTRLVRELRARQLADGATVAVGSCVELGADLLPYAPFVESIGRLVEDLGDRADELLGAERTDLATLLPGLAQPTDEPAGAGGSRGRMYEAVRALLDRHPGLLVVVLEDIHWADRSTLELLDYLARRLRHGRTLLLATYRTDELHRRHPLPPLLAELERTGRSSSIRVGPLDREQVARLVRELGVVPGPAAALDAIARRSGGNPFLVEELVAAGAGGADQLPGTIRELLLARVAAVDAATRRALGIVAAVGRPAEAELVEMAWDGSEADLHGGLRDAVDRGLLVVEPSSRRRLAFRHALLAEAVADDLLPGERVRLHASLARILAERPDLASATPAGAAAELAHHLLESRDQAAALAAVVRAADAAATARAYPEARTSYERALELWERVPAAAAHAGIDHATLLDRAAEASFHAGDVARAIALGRAAVDDADAAGDRVRTGYLLVRLIEWVEEVDFEALAALAERALALVPEEPPSPERAFALIGLGAKAQHRSRNAELLRAVREAADVAAACGAVGYEAIARSMAGIALVGLARDDEAAAEARRAADLAAASRGTEEVVITTVNCLAVDGFPGHLDRVADQLPEARVAVDREGSAILSESYFGLWEVAILAWQGCWTDAVALASEHLAGEWTTSNPSVDLLSLRGGLQVRRGRLDDGERDLRRALELRAVAFAETMAEVHALLAEAALQRGDPRAALAEVEDGLAVLEPTDDVSRRARLYAAGLQAAADLSERSRARRERDGAAVAEAARGTYLDRLQAVLDGRLVEEGGVNDLVRAMGAWGLAEASRCAGEPDPDRWADAAAGLPPVGETHLAAYCRFREAESVLAGPGNRARAVEALRAARAWAVKVGAEPLLRDVDGLARRARLAITELTSTGRPAEPPAPTAARDPYGLSPREREVLALLLDGRTNRQIGDALFISDKTASVHVTHILDKMGVTSRGAAAALAARAGLLDDAGR
jgi:DNA-binding CsgD family transcriptional regulator/tetratricopeptide (TPR) repeat protein